MRRTHGAMGALGLVLALVVAGCTDDPEPRFAEPTPTTSAPTSTEPTSVPPSSEPTSEPATQTEVLSPERTVRAWVEAYNGLTTSGDDADLVPLIAESCLGCAEFTDPIVNLYASGGRMETSGIKVVSARRTPDFHRTGLVAAAVNIARGRTIPAESGPINFEARSAIVQFKLLKEDGQWRISELVFLS